MKTIFRILKWGGILLLVVVVGLLAAGTVLYNKTYEAPYPNIHASTDSAVIARGKHLVFATGHCPECHYAPGDSLKVINGDEALLAGGGFPFEWPGGKFYSVNISSDKETGIGNWKDEEIARAFRHQISPNGKVLMPLMPFQEMADEDIAAIISYLRTVPPVKFKVPENELNLFGKFVMAFLLRPEEAKETPPQKMTPDTTVEYGKYLVWNVSGCRGCHTKRDLHNGKYVGEDLAGGSTEPVPGDPTRLLYAANLTPDPETGVLYNWTFEQFKNRFKQGRLIPETIMPWGQFKHLDDTELLAIWKYLKTVKPVKNEINGYVQKANS